MIAISIIVRFVITYSDQPATKFLRLEEGVVIEPVYIIFLETVLCLFNLDADLRTLL